MPIVVLGCGKGGTSLVSELLARMDVDMGVDLPEVSNRKYRRHDPSYKNFEHQVIRILNHRFLADTGFMWWDSPPMDRLLRMKQQLRWQDKILEAIQGKVEPWGWKCALNGVMIPLFHPHLKDPKYVVIRRTDEKQHIESWVRHRYRHLKGVQYEEMKRKTMRGRAMIYDRIDQFLERYRIPGSQICELTFEELTDRGSSFSAVKRLGNFIGATQAQIKTAHGIIEYD